MHTSHKPAHAPLVKQHLLGDTSMGHFSRAKVHAAQERHINILPDKAPSQRIPSAATLGQARHTPVLTGMAAQVLTVVLGQDLPDEAASAMQQQFALVVAVIGLAAFALVLALIEQLVLSVLDDNVRRGSRVYERGHVRPRR